MKKNLQRGFTLIELLVVIAIIGMLAAVVLASLNSARAKGADAALKSNLGNARAEAEIFYDTANPDSYEGVCALTGTNVIGDSVLAAAAATGAAYASADDTADASATAAVCHDSGTGWAAMAPIYDDTNGWCVDSTGVAELRPLNSLNTNSDVTCR